MLAFLDLGLPNPGEEASWSESDLTRLLCHVLIQRLPEGGLGEAAESLSEMCRFYATPLPPPKPLPPPDEQPIPARYLGQRVETYPAVIDLD